MNDPFDDPDVQDWARSVREDLVPKLRGSAASISLVPRGDVQPGTPIPERLARVADVILEGDLTDPAFGARVQAAISKVLGS